MYIDSSLLNHHSYEFGGTLGDEKPSCQLDAGETAFSVSLCIQFRPPNVVCNLC